MNSDEILEPGTQIAYVPAHAKGDVNHPDVGWGFVQEQRGETALCRFWAKDRQHKHQIGDLRTKANAESASLSDLVLHQHCRQEMINSYLRVRGGQKLADRRMFGMPLGLRKMR